jgi:hypothetical protein
LPASRSQVSGELYASITASDSDLSRAFLIMSRAEEVHHKTERPDRQLLGAKECIH